MTEKEKCGDFEIFKDDEGKWIVENSITKEVIGKFQYKKEAIEKVASILQNDEDRSENESVC